MSLSHQSVQGIHLSFQLEEAGGRDQGSGRESGPTPIGTIPNDVAKVEHFMYPFPQAIICSWNSHALIVSLARHDPTRGYSQFDSEIVMVSYFDLASK